jgi:hypothetical protein
MNSIGLKKRISKFRCSVFVAALALAAIPAAAQSSQQGSTSQGDSQSSQSSAANQNQGAQNPGSQNPSDTDQQPIQETPGGLVSLAPPETQITQLGTANPLSAIGRYHWGPFYLGSSDARIAYDSIQSANVAEFGPSEANTLSLLETSIVVDKTWDRNRFTFQYQPRVAATDGDVAYDYLNQQAGINTFFMLSPRWTLGLSDRFLATRNSGLAGGVYADANTVTSTTLQSDFLDNSETYMTDIASLSASYAVSPRMLLTFSPSFVYQRTSGLTTAEGGDITAADVAFDARFRYLLNARTSVGAYSTESFVQFTGLIPTSTYYTFGASVSRQLTMTIGVSANVGVTESVFQSEQYWGESGEISVFKVFPRGRVSVVYSRGLPGTGYVTNYLNQRVDVIGYYQFSRRLTGNAGVGYEAQESNPEVVSGKYATGEVDYVLSPNWGVFTSYAYKIQYSNNPQVFGGIRNFASIGIRWNPNAGPR